MSSVTPMVFIVDDDISVRESLELLIQNEGWKPETFASAQEFLDRPRVFVPSCLVLDISLPGLNGLELQKRVAAERTRVPQRFVERDAERELIRRRRERGAAELLGRHVARRTAHDRRSITRLAVARFLARSLARSLFGR